MAKKKNSGDEAAQKEKDKVQDKFTFFLTAIKKAGVHFTSTKYGFPKPTPCAPFIENKWRTGGISGGSCWDTGDGDHHYPVEGDPESEFRDFDIHPRESCSSAHVPSIQESGP